MKPKLNDFAELVAKANDKFMAAHKEIDSKPFDTLMGIIDKALRNQGMMADAVTLDAVVLNKKLVFLLPDIDPDLVEVAFGNKHGDIFEKQRHSLSGLDVDAIYRIIEQYFLGH